MGATWDGRPILLLFMHFDAVADVVLRRVTEIVLQPVSSAGRTA